MSTRANFTITIDCPDGGLGNDVFPYPADLAANRQEALSLIGDFFDRLAGGWEPGAAGETKVSLQKGSTAAGAAPAAGTLTLSTASGAVGGTICGTLVTATAAGGDTASAVLVAAAINANSTVNKFVSATSALGVVTVSALVPGVPGNRFTLVASGTGVTASGALLAGGVGGDGAPATVSF